MNRIRAATELDREAVRDVHLRAFPEGEGQMVARLAVDLLREQRSPEIVSLVAEIDGAVVGHIAFSPVTVENNEEWKGYILAPLGVKPEFQNQRIGSALIGRGIERLSGSGVQVLFVYGDPGYYGKFGFNADAASGYSPPFELQFPFGWQALRLNKEVFPESAVAISCVAALRDPALW